MCSDQKKLQKSIDVATAEYVAEEAAAKDAEMSTRLARFLLSIVRALSRIKIIIDLRNIDIIRL